MLVMVVEMDIVEELEVVDHLCDHVPATGGGGGSTGTYTGNALAQELLVYN